MPLSMFVDIEARAWLTSILDAKGVSDSGTLLLESRMALGMPSVVSQVRLRESGVRLLLETLNARIADLKAATTGTITVSEFKKTAMTFADYDRVLRRIYRIGRGQRQIITLSTFAMHLIRAEKRLLNAVSDESLKALGDTLHFSEILDTADERFQQLVKTEIALRQMRFHKGCDLLSSADSDLADRFVAAFGVRLDGQYLMQTLSDSDSSRDFFQAKHLKQLVELERNFDMAQENAGDLWDRSYRFYVGLDWWRRGRYGKGRFGGGMLKGFEALQSFDQQMVLNMPQEFPRSTKPSGGVTEYPLSRRHRYHWQIEPNKGKEVRSVEWFC